MTVTPHITEASVALLRDLTIIPQVVGYDHRISELDNARLIQWISGQGYFVSDEGRAFLAQRRAA